MHEDLISIVVPVYNVERYIRNCMDSILNQSYNNIEVILIDDGSVDDSSNICDHYVNIDTRVKVIHQSNRGLSAARNKGLETASGKYVMFVDSDDDILPDCVEYLYHLLRKHQTRMAICAYSTVILNKNKQKIINIGRSFHEECLTTENALERMLNEAGFTVSSCAKLYDLALFDTVRFPVKRLCEDNGTTYKLIMQCDKIAYGNQSKYNYYRRENSIMTSNFNLKKVDMILLNDMMCADILNKFPSLENSIKRRKMYARFNVLRQMVKATLDEQEIIAKQEIIKYLKTNKNDILKNPVSSFRDRMAILTLLVHEKVFKISWNIYEFLSHIF
ncbi:MAG: glycosyltransferase [Bacilli bacterium]|nr:glycosyltransferase [Bacilli bacterium]